MSNIKIEQKITLHIGNNVVEITHEEADELFNQLKVILGKTDNIITPYIPYTPPITPPPTIVPDKWLPVYPWPYEIWCGTSTDIKIKNENENSDIRN